MKRVLLLGAVVAVALCATGKTYFGPQTPVNDAVGANHWCALAEINRSQAVPPTVAQFSALLAVFQNRAAKVR